MEDKERGKEGQNSKMRALFVCVCVSGSFDLNWCGVQLKLRTLNTLTLHADLKEAENQKPYLPRLC